MGAPRLFKGVSLVQKGSKERSPENARPVSRHLNIHRKLFKISANNRHQSDISVGQVPTTPSSRTSSFPKEQDGSSIIPCGICSKPFSSSQAQALLAHLGGHFDRDHEFNRCQICQINFVSADDLRRHLALATEHQECGYMFEHREHPCTGHHAPRLLGTRDDARFNFCYRLRGWEETQLQGFAEKEWPLPPSPSSPSSASHDRKFSSVVCFSDLIAKSSRISRLMTFTSIPSQESFPSLTQKMPNETILSATLLRAICTGSLHLVASFVQAGAARTTFSDALGFSAMHYAAQYGTPEITQLLLQSGADVHAIDHRGKTPLSHAISTGRIELVPFLLAWGAEPNRKDLKRAVKTGNVNIVEMLIEWWVREQRCGDALDGMLKFAAERKNQTMAEVLLKIGAKAKVDGEAGRNALQYGVDGGEKTGPASCLERHSEPEVSFGKELWLTT